MCFIVSSTTKTLKEIQSGPEQAIKNQTVSVLYHHTVRMDGPQEHNHYKTPTVSEHRWGYIHANCKEVKQQSLVLMSFIRDLQLQ